MISQIKNWNQLASSTDAEILDWAEQQNWAIEMAACMQDPAWHAEGDVWTHTKMVADELAKLDDWDSLSRKTQIKLLVTGLLHDCGKPATTVLDETTGHIRSPKHAQVGSRMARRLLMEMECDFATREKICNLVSYHGRPPYLSEKTNPERELIKLSAFVDHRLLFLRSGTDFALNATNITQQTRKLWIDLGADYNARIEVVYIEPPLKTLFAQNKDRESRVPTKVIERLISKLDVPTIAECHELLTPTFAKS